MFSNKILAGLFIGFIVISSGCLNSGLPDNFRSDALYELDISADIPLHNATFLIPLPVKNDTPMVGTLKLKQSLMENDNCSVEIIPAPLDIPENISIPGHHNNTWYLKISTKENAPDSVFNGYHILIQNIKELDKPDFPVNTYTPYANDSVFLPKQNFSPITPLKEPSQTSRSIVFRKSMTGYRIPVFIDIPSTQNASVRITSQIKGANIWSYEDFIGNYYTDSFMYSHSGESHGWQNAQGTIIYADGVYPNISDPVWQKVLK
jgi:hypothetical protein